MSEPEVRKYDNDGNELAIRFGLGGIKAVGVGIMENLVNNRNQDNEFKDIYDFAGRLGTKIINKKSIEALAKAGAFDNIHQSRKQIFESCEIINKYAASKEEEKSSNQLSLFDATSKVGSERPALKVVEDWKKVEKLQKEFEAFGFFVNQHPIDDFLSDLKRRGIIFSDKLDSDEINDNNIIKLAGVVAYSKHKSGPKGRYAYLTLSDPIGIFETSIFNEELITNSRDLMESGMSLVVECLVKKDEGGIRLLVKTIQKLDEFIKNTPAKKEAYQDIRVQPPRRDFDWKNKKNNDYDSKNDSLVLEMEYKKRIEELKNKKIFPEVLIEIKNREMILNTKSFLSQKLAPEGFEKVTKVFILVKNNDGDVKIELTQNYLLDENDMEKIKLITSEK